MERVKTIGSPELEVSFGNLTPEVHTLVSHLDRPSAPTNIIYTCFRVILALGSK